MNKRYNVFISLALVISIGIMIDVFIVNDKSDQDNKLISILDKKNFTNIKVFGNYRGSECKGFNITRLFKAEKQGKIASGMICASSDSSKNLITVEVFEEKTDPTKLIF